MDTKLSREIEAALTNSATRQADIDLKFSHIGLLGGLLLNCNAANLKPAATSPNAPVADGTDSKLLQEIKQHKGVDLSANPTPLAVIIVSDGFGSYPWNLKESKIIPIWADPAKQWQEPQPATDPKVKNAANPAAPKASEYPTAISWHLVPADDSGPEPAVPADP